MPEVKHFYQEAFSKRFKVPQYTHYEEVLELQRRRFRELYG